MKKVQKNILITAGGGALVLVVLFSFLLLYHQQPVSQNTNYLAAVSNTVTTKQNQPVPGIPVRLIIPNIHVNANVIQVGLTKTGAVDTPKGPYDVAWYKLGPEPGQLGSSVIVGHYGTWADGAHSVFDNLNKLKKGDIIQVKNNNGIVISFAVRETKIYNPDDVVPEIFNKKDGTYLNLITCNGTWIPGQKTFNKRLVVFSDLIK